MIQRREASSLQKIENEQTLALVCGIELQIKTNAVNDLIQKSLSFKVVEGKEARTDSNACLWH